MNPLLVTAALLGGFALAVNKGRAERFRQIEAAWREAVSSARRVIGTAEALYPAWASQADYDLYHLVREYDAAKAAKNAQHADNTVAAVLALRDDLEHRMIDAGDRGAVAS